MVNRLPSKYQLWDRLLYKDEGVIKAVEIMYICFSRQGCTYTIRPENETREIVVEAKDLAAYYKGDEPGTY